MDPVSSLNWESVLLQIGRSSYRGAQPAGPFWFGDSPELSEKLVSLVVAGQKTATASLLWEWEFDGDDLPNAGHLEALLSWTNDFEGIIRTTVIEIVPFEAVDAGFAALEGEGDLSLDFWRRVHWNFFSGVCARIGKTPRPNMPIVCQQFALEYRDAMPDCCV